MATTSQTRLSPEWTSAPTALQSRMQQLEDRIEECKRRLAGQNKSVAEVCRGALELQGQAESLKKTLEGMAQRLQALGVDTVSAAEVAAAIPVSVASTPPTHVVVLPAPEVPQSSGPDASDPKGGLLRCIPYILIAAAGIGYGSTSRTVEAAAPAASSLRASVVSASVLAGAPVPAEPEKEALGLVYEYRLPGAEADMLDLVGGQEDALGPSPWQIECDESNRCDVSFNSRVGRDEEPLYEFAVDLGAKSVTPSSTTVDRLRADASAQNAAG